MLRNRWWQAAVVIIEGAKSSTCADRKSVHWWRNERCRESQYAEDPERKIRHGRRGFLSAELEIVPARCEKPEKLVSDRSTDHVLRPDDSSLCLLLKAILDVKEVKKNGLLHSGRQRRIGSVGANPGMESRLFENTIAESFACAEKEARSWHYAEPRKFQMLSDVVAAADPLRMQMRSVIVKTHLAGARCGEAGMPSKFTGSRGKSGSNDATQNTLLRSARLSWTMQSSFSAG